MFVDDNKEKQTNKQKQIYKPMARENISPELKALQQLFLMNDDNDCDYQFQ